MKDEAQKILDVIRAKKAQHPQDEFGRKIATAFEDEFSSARLKRNGSIHDAITKDQVDSQLIFAHEQPVGGDVLTVGEPIIGDPLTIAWCRYAG